MPLGEPLSPRVYLESNVGARENLFEVHRQVRTVYQDAEGTSIYVSK
jgi:hypothetical protein